MSRKTKELSDAEKEVIVVLHKQGKSLRQIAKEVKKPFRTVHYVIGKYKQYNSVENKARSGRPKILSNRDERQILSEVAKNPRISARTLAIHIESSSGKIVCAETVRKVLRKSNYHGRVARKKPFISEANRAKRVQYANSFKDKPLEFWRKVLFTDESKFNVFGSDGRQIVWRKPRTELLKQHLTPSVKHGGGHVMVWGSMSYNGVGQLHFIDGILDAKGYLKILQEEIPRSIAKLNMQNDYMLLHDNDPKHTSRIVKEWLLYRVPTVLPHPPQSPDLNVIENLWHILDLGLRKKTFQIRAI